MPTPPPSDPAPPAPDPGAPPGAGTAARLTRILDFLLFVDRFKSICRRSYLADGSRAETDAEHCWHMAMYAMLLHREIGFEADLGRTLCLIAAHDLVEIHAGDTYAYDDAGLTTQAAREREAAELLFARLPDDLGRHLHALWREFEDGRTPEARFARALDRLQAFGQGVAAGGRAWQENAVARDRTRLRMQEALDADPAIRELVETLYRRADEAGMWLAVPEAAP